MVPMYCQIDPSSLRSYAGNDDCAYVTAATAIATAVIAAATNRLRRASKEELVLVLFAISYDLLGCDQGTKGERCGLQITKCHKKSFEVLCSMVPPCLEPCQQTYLDGSPSF